MSRRRTALLWLLKSAATVALLAWIFSRPEIRASLDGWHAMDARWLAAGFAFAGAGQILAAARWAACLRMFSLRLPAADLVRITLAGTGAGFLSIGSLGNDAVRVALAAGRLPSSRGMLIASVGADHLSALPGFLALAFAVLRTAPIESPGQSLGLMIAASVAGFFAIGLLLRRFHRGWHDRIRAFLSRPAAIRGFAAATLWSLPMLALHYGTFWCAGRAVGVNIPAADFLGVAAAADVVASLPLTIAGLGVREHAFETLLHRWHNVPSGDAVTLSLAGFALLLVWGAAGALWAVSRLRHRPPPPPD